MGLKCGIVGLPNAGKSTLFNALTSSQNAKAANYPFCTIEPNLGTVAVPDSRLNQIADLIQPEKILPVFLEFVDIAGLVQGASQGEGLGNLFLSHIRETHSLLHVVRGFTDSRITSVYKTPDPKRDVEVINLELLLADLEVVEKRFNKIAKAAQTTGDKKLKAEKVVLEKVLESLKKDIPLRSVSWSEMEKSWIKQLNFITLKPVLYICNQNGEDVKGNSVEQTIQSLCGEKDEVISLSCAMESEISQLEDSEKKDFLADMGLDEPVLNRVIRKAYKQLNLITFFTAGKKEVRAWTVPSGALAPQAGGVIHSDFERGFIRAEVYSCKDLFKHKTEKELSAQGLIRLEGKNYIVQDGDVIHFRFKV